MYKFRMTQPLGAMTLMGLLGVAMMACSGDAARDVAPQGESETEESLETKWVPKDAPVEKAMVPYGDEGQMKEVQYSVVNGEAILEGDIVLGPVDALLKLLPILDPLSAGDVEPMGIAIPGKNRRWKNKTVAYQLEQGFPNAKRITDAIAHWKTNTSLTFVERTSQNASQHRDYITFRTGDGCSSTVGRKGGQQYITMADGCGTGAAIHEIGHAVGLWHEQSREDRNNFITVNLANVTSGMEHNFDQHISDGDDIGTYDFNSIMHYHALAFSKNGQPTIVAKNGEKFGQRDRLSQGDLSAVATLYP